MRFTLNRRRRQLGFLLFKLAVLTAIVLAFYYLYRALFTINSIHCQLKDSPCPDPIQVELEKLHGQNLLRLDLSALSTKITSANPLIVRTDLSVSLPGTIMAQLTPAQIIAQITTASSSSALSISQSYQVVAFQSEPSPELPLIIYPPAQNLRLGDHIDSPELIQAINLAQSLKANFIQFDYLVINSSTAQTTLNNGTQVTFSLNQSYSSQIDTLKLILRQTKRPISAINLQFQKPTIVFLE